MSLTLDARAAEFSGQLEKSRRLLDQRFPIGQQKAPNQGRHPGRGCDDPGSCRRWRPYAATVISESFRGKSRVQQHQIVYQSLKGQMGGVLHALALQTGVPEA